MVPQAAAADLGVDIGDSVTIRGDMGNRRILQCPAFITAPTTWGANLGMNREGWLSIGQDDPRLWCHHFFWKILPRRKRHAVLEEAYGGDIHVQ